MNHHTHHSHVDIHDLQEFVNMDYLASRVVNVPYLDQLYVHDMVNEVLPLVLVHKNHRLSQFHDHMNHLHFPIQYLLTETKYLNREIDIR